MKVSLLKSIPLLIMLLVGCTEDPSSKPDDPNNPDTPQLTLSVAELNYSDGGGSQSVVIRSNASWTVSGTNDWCTVDHIDGSYDGEITATAQPNAGYDDRSVNLTVKAGNITRILTINQRKKDALTLTQGRYEIKQEGGVIAVEVKHNLDFTVSIPQEFATWIISVATKGLATSSLQFDIAANPGYDPREGRIIIRNSDGTLTDTLYVTQAQLDKLGLTEQQRTVAPEAGTVAVAINTNPDYDVIIPNEASWITLAPQTKGLRQEEYTFSIDAHTGYNSRSAEIVFKDRNSPAADTLHIIQLGQTVFENMTIALGTDQTISSLFSNTQLASIKKLTVTGSINVSDFTTVRTKMLNLEEIDLGATTCTLIPQTAFSKHPSLQKIILPSQTKTIEFSAFYECTSLKAIDIPQNVRKIPYAAFYRCYALETVTLPDEITSIGEAAFAECFSLKDFAMPTNCTVLGKSAFSSCGELKGPIHLSEGMVELPDNAFTGCANLLKIKLPNTLRSIGKSALSGIGADTLDIPSEVHTIGEYAFSSSGIRSITLPHHITTISQSLCLNCQQLKSVDIPEGVTSIARSAFWQNSPSSLEHVTLPSTLSSIQDMAFPNIAQSITSIALIPPTLEYGAIPNGPMHWADANIPVFVPAASVEAYKAAPGWNKLNPLAELI